MIPNAVQSAMLIAVVFVIGRVIFRGAWGGVLTAGIVLTVFILGESSSDRLLVSIALIAIVTALMVATFLYCGLLSAATMFLVNQALNNSPMTLDLSRPYASGSLWTIALVLGLALFGFYGSRQGQPLLGGLLKPD
jgi:hypothetical protein